MLEGILLALAVLLILGGSLGSFLRPAERACRQFERALAPKVQMHYERVREMIADASSKGCQRVEVQTGDWDPLVTVRVKRRLMDDCFLIHPYTGYFAVTWSRD